MLPERLVPADGDAARLLLVNLAEVFYLIRALGWVQQSSQSTQVVAYIDQCMGQLHRDTSCVSDWADGIHMVTIWCVLSSLINGHARSPHLALLHGLSNDQGGVTQLRRISGGHTNFPRLHIPSPLDHLLPVVMRLLAQPAMQQATDPSNVAPRPLRRCIELLGALQHIASDNFIDGVDRTWYVDTLMTIRHVYGSHNDTVRLMTFNSLSRYGKVTIDEDQTLCEAHATLLPLECSLITN